MQSSKSSVIRQSGIALLNENYEIITLPSTSNVVSSTVSDIDIHLKLNFIYCTVSVHKT